MLSNTAQGGVAASAPRKPLTDMVESWRQISQAAAANTAAETTARTTGAWSIRDTGRSLARHPAGGSPRLRLSASCGRMRI